MKKNNVSLQHLRFHLEPKAPLHMPAYNKGNVIRGGFGSTFRLSAVAAQAGLSACDAQAGRIVCRGNLQSRVRDRVRGRENEGGAGGMRADFGRTSRPARILAWAAWSRVS